MEGMKSIFMILLIFFVFWFFMIRPQAKKQKELKKFRESLSKGDKVVTIGGIHGKILEISDTTVLLSCESSSKIRVEKSALVSAFSEAETAAK
jgi:preprotein translocase subunit YajC